MRYDGSIRSQTGRTVRIFGRFGFRPGPARRMAIVLTVGLLLGSSAFGQARKSITWERFNASGPELKPLGLLAVRHAEDIDSSPWSVGCETLDRDQARFRVYEDYVGELGVKHARLQSGWAKCEKQQGIYDFAWLDEGVWCDDSRTFDVAHEASGGIYFVGSTDGT